MNILLVYSKVHFDPDLPQEKQKRWGSSASILARTLYHILGQKGKLTYIHFDKHATVKGKHFDLVVAISNGIADLFKYVSFDKFVFFSVNMSMCERNQILTDFICDHDLNRKELLKKGDFVDEQAMEYVRRADFILGVGNNAVLNSYLKYGIDGAKIKMLNYGILDTSLSISPSLDSRKRFVYVASDIGLRKGFDLVYDLFLGLKKGDYALTIIGSAFSPYYQAKLDVLQTILGDRCQYYGWIESNSAEYDAILKAQDFLVFPSLEEGQAGTVLDCMVRGVIPMLTPASGFDFSPLGFLDTALDSSQNKGILQRAMKLSSESVNQLKEKTLEYYKEMHASFEHSFEDAIDAIITQQSLCPKISITLPIFNKEKTIIPLLECLDRACTAYKNVELHIFFDGCVDQSEALVREFFETHPGYEVSFESTPDIFEVKTNNLGLKKSTGKYAVILQDDIFIYDDQIFFEAVGFLEKNSRCAILGGLAGVNFYPLGTKNLSGKGQISMTENEVYWRQDAKTDPKYKHQIFEVDACMRGPLFIRKDFLEQHGYLDEAYAPLYNDDMDLCFRAKAYGFKVYCMLLNVEKVGSSMAHTDEAQYQWWQKIISDNTKTFYSRYTPSTEKNYLRLERIPLTSKASSSEVAPTPLFLTQPSKRKKSIFTLLACLVPNKKLRRKIRTIGG